MAFDITATCYTVAVFLHTLRGHDVESYNTLIKAGQGRYEEGRSVFLGCAAAIAGESGVSGILADLRAEHSGARHVCHAFRLLDGTARFSDDGEPSGTAGRPIYNLITTNNLFNCIITVVRYFGGTLLGTGGLVRAYSSAASAALDDGRVACLRRGMLIGLDCGYSLYDSLLSRLSAAGAVIISTAFNESIAIEMAVETEKWPLLYGSITELSRGDMKPIIKKEDFFNFDAGDF